MSLNPEDSRRRGRSRSPGGREERSRSRVDERERNRVIAPSPPSSRYEDNDRYEYEERTTTRSRPSDPRDWERNEEERYAQRDYNDHKRASPPSRKQPAYAVPGEFKYEEEEVVKSRYGGGETREKDYYSEKKYRDESPPTRYAETTKKTYYEDRKYGRDDHEENDYYEEKKYERDDRKGKDYYEEKKYRTESPPSPKPRYEEHKPRYEEPKPRYEEPKPRYEEPKPRYEDAKHRYEDEQQRDHSFSVSGGINISHGHGSESPKRGHSPSPPYGNYIPAAITAGHSKYAEPKKWEYAQPEEKITYSRKESYTSRPAPSAGQVVTVEPGKRHASIGHLGGSLSVAAAAGVGTSLALAPGSPLLESYHGTYQSISPMPSPLMIAAAPHNSSLELASLDIGSKRRHARFHDPKADASALARALKGSKMPDVEPLIEILPALTHEQILDLRIEYKKIVKTGKEAKGVNIAKHIKMRLKDEDSALMKACYATALGKWESEAYWANFWYQGEKSRRELLIESLMGRTNSEIRAIKDGFSDKKYSDSLTKCMKQELKEDKFKKAVLLVLDERRMEERVVDRGLIEDDVRELHKAVRSEKGGETTMIGIIVLRSDTHLREVLKIYEATYRANFAREMLKKSGNLVGELLAHILNGVINRPVRDALLLNHALSLTKSDSLRTELLVSRLVRFHWDRPHMEAVKREYRSRYGKDLQQAVADGTRGDWGEFCEELCVRRMGDEVREVRRVEYRSG